MSNYKILRLEASNVKRLRAVAVEPDGSVVVIGGRNGAGKSSLLDSIEMLFAGNKSIPADPVRHGTAKATIVADLGDIIVEKTITNRGAKLVVRGADGQPLKSPQKLLDELCNKVAFDPSQFLRMKPAEQDKLLKQAAGIDFTELDADRAQLYERRTELNRTVKHLEAKVSGMVEHADAPAKAVSPAELIAELETRQSAHDRAAERLREARDDVRRNRDAIDRVKEQISKLQAELVLHEQDLQANTQAEAEREAELSQCSDPTEIKEQLSSVEETNRKVRENAERAVALDELERARKLAQDCTDAIDGIDAQKQELLERASFPIEGLGFSDLGPTLGGVPLEQASQAQKLRVSVAIGLAQNPRLRVLLVRDGSLMDTESLRLLAQLADEQDCQVWVERVSEDGEGCSVVIEDGSVKANSEAAE